jgi:acyl-CoA synthetase (AMP-forming)/AMP-acid ligase II
MRNNLGLVLAKRAQISREIEALVEVERGHRYTYAELNAVANRAAHALAERGIGKGDRVALLLMNGVEFLATYFGGAKIGAVTVPLNWRLVADELEFILKDAGAKVLIWDPDFDETVTELRGRDLPIERWIRVGEASERGEAWDDICARRPPVHHVHLGDHGPAQGRGAHARFGAVGLHHDQRDRGHADR